MPEPSYSVAALGIVRGMLTNSRGPHWLTAERNRDNDANALHRTIRPAMNAPAIVHTLLAAYLAATLGATALAKLRNWGTSLAGMIRESVVPGPGIKVVLLAVSVSEFSLATLIAFDIESRIAGLAASTLFVLFAGYRLVVAAKTKSMICSCAGKIRNDPGSPPVVLGATLACLLMAACAGALALDSRSPGYPLDLISIAAWLAPILGLAVGARRQRGKHDRDSTLTGEFFQLGSADLSVRR